MKQHTLAKTFNANGPDRPDSPCSHQTAREARDAHCSADANSGMWRALATERVQPRPFSSGYRSRARGLLLTFALASCLLITPAQAQLREAEDGGYVVRANVASAQTLPSETRERHNLGAAEFLINVVVLKQGAPIAASTVDAEVVVETTDLIGTRARVNMRATKVNDYIAYMGSFDAPLNDKVLDFYITARPAGSATSIELRFRENLPNRR